MIQTNASQQRALAAGFLVVVTSERKLVFFKIEENGYRNKQSA
jgi:hypothetical protein